MFRTIPIPTASIFVSFLILISLSATTTRLHSQNSIPKNFDIWVNKEMAAWNLPGMAVAVVKDGEILMAKGFGEKKSGSGNPVDEHTVFGIASVSKNITAAALAILVDEGKLNWDDKVIDHIPWFALSDPWVTSQVTVKDLLTHRVGVGRMLGNRLQFMTNHKRDEVIYQMRYMDFEAPFRDKSVYSNVMYTVAGQLIEYIEGVSWDAFLTERLFKPLGMNNTNTSITQFTAQTNLATPHQEIEGKITPITWRNWDNGGPAGAVNSTVSDVAKWMLMQLGTPGTYENKSLISESQMREMHRPQIISPISNPYDSQASYGFGWNIFDYKGERILTHGGATDGFNTSVYMLPNQNLGIVVVTNSFSLFREAVVYTLIDSFLNIKDTDWGAHYFNRYQDQYARVKQMRENMHQAREKNTKTKHVLEAYTGTYSDTAYGTIEIFKQGNDLKVRFWNSDDLTATLEHWHHDTFRAVWNNPAQREEFSWFTMDKDGNVDAFHFEIALRPLLLQVGAYPSNYSRVVQFKRN
jgi:CubicO group peptidase (beta-lactamase class C family)